MNNKYYFQRCPALVNNNRNFTSFVINSEMNREVKDKLKATDEHSYRKLLQLIKQLIKIVLLFY